MIQLRRPPWRQSPWHPQPPLLRSVRTKAAAKDRPHPPTKPIIEPSSKAHNDMPSFLAHAETHSLCTMSSVFKGALYEYTVKESLVRFGFDLTRTGKRSDLGIDLLGHWAVPSLPVPLRTLMQCKAHRKKLTPDNVRELEGAFSGAPPGWCGDGVIGFLVAAESASKGMRDALVRSKCPLAFMQVKANGVVEQFLWNHGAGQLGLEGMGVTTRFSNGGEEKEVALTWNGWAIAKVMDEEEEDEEPRPRRKSQVSTTAKSTTGLSQASGSGKRRGRPKKK